MVSKRSANAWLTAYVVVGALNVLGVLTSSSVLSTLTKPFLMPLLLIYFVAALDGLQHPLATWVVRALVLSWLGDLLLMGDGQIWFGLGLLAFLGAQICYISGFRPYASLSPLRRQPWLAVVYLGAGAALLALLAGGLGALLIPVAVYAAALVAMAMLATGVSPMTGTGGALFLISDGLIALTELSDVAGSGAAMLIMPTYIVGQALIVQGVLQRLGRGSLRRTAVGVA